MLLEGKEHRIGVKEELSCNTVQRPQPIPWGVRAEVVRSEFFQVGVREPGHYATLMVSQQMRAAPGKRCDVGFAIFFQRRLTAKGYFPAAGAGEISPSFLRGIWAINQLLIIINQLLSQGGSYICFLYRRKHWRNKQWCMWVSCQWFSVCHEWDFMGNKFWDRDRDLHTGGLLRVGGMNMSV